MDRADILQVADRFFDGSSQGRWDDVVALLAPGAVVWRNVHPVDVLFLDELPSLEKLAAAMGPWTYGNVKRMIGDEGFCEQHEVRFSGGRRGPSTIDVCAVIVLDDDGRITRIDEYFSAAPVPKSAASTNSAVAARPLGKVPPR